MTQSTKSLPWTHQGKETKSVDGNTGTWFSFPSSDIEQPAITDSHKTGPCLLSDCIQEKDLDSAYQADANKINFHDASKVGQDIMSTFGALGDNQPAK